MLAAIDQSLSARGELHGDYTAIIIGIVGIYMRGTATTLQETLLKIILDWHFEGHLGKKKAPPPP